MTERKSIIWELEYSELYEVVKKSTSIRQILVHFGIDPQGTLYKTLYKRLKEDNIDHSHIVKGLGANKGKSFPKIDHSKIFIEGSKVARGVLKRRILTNNILPNCCAICGQLPIWNEKKLVLVLDHINGTNNDNRLENLRLLCPNCNSQTDTFCQKK